MTDTRVDCMRRLIRGRIGRGEMQTPLQTFASKLCATLDLSRGLRMDEQNHQTSRSPSGSGGSPNRVSGAPRPADSESSSTVLYYGDDARVKEGFAIALGLLGLSAGMAEGVTVVCMKDAQGR
jgi:hypothetical protein